MKDNSSAFHLGYEIMSQVCPDKHTLANAYGIVAAFLNEMQDVQSSKKPVSYDFLARHAQGFVRGRLHNGPTIPKTIPDKLLRDILKAAYAVPDNMLDVAIRYHMEAMGAENFIGWILESYIACHAEPIGWVWCSGAVIRAVDFIKPIGAYKWRMLQIKNRSNSENSSSSRVRLGTTIEKWFRIYARNGATNWNTFPDDELRKELSEDGFRDYIINWIRQNFQKKQ